MAALDAVALALPVGSVKGSLLEGIHITYKNIDTGKTSRLLLILLRKQNINDLMV